mgnify:CR=1 FL=1
MQKLIFLPLTIITFLLGLHAISAQTISDVSKHRIEGKFTIIEYSLNTNMDECGVIWSSTGNPDFTNKVSNSSPSIDTYQDSVTGLNTDTKYYFRVYAIEAGVDTTYSELDSLTTQPYAQPPFSVGNLSSSDIDSSSITINWASGFSTKFWITKDAEGTSQPSIENIIDMPGSDPETYYPTFADANVTDRLTRTYNTLEPNTTYTYVILPAQASSTTDGQCNVRQDAPSTIQASTLKGKPRTHASNVNFTDVTETSATVNWTRGNGDECVVFINTTELTERTDGATYTADNSWNNSGEQCVYKGTGTSVSVSNLDETKNYHFTVFEYNHPNDLRYYDGLYPAINSGILLGKATWNGTASSSWSNDANWSTSKAPYSSQEVIIADAGSNNDAELSSTQSIGSMTIEAGGNLTVNNSGDLTVSGAITIESDGTGQGALIINGTGAVSAGSATYNRSITDDGSWHLMGNPTNGTAVTPFTGYYAKTWSEPDAAWNYLTSSSTLSTMEGYSVQYASAADGYVEFSGSDFNNGNQSVGVTNFDTNDTEETYGWNLIGNPYPSPINWDLYTTETGINGTVYQYNGSGYISYNTTNSSGDANANFIQPCQGFFIFSDNSSATLTLTNSLRVKSGTSYYKKEVNNDKTSFTINLNNGDYEDNAYIVYYPGGTDEFDNALDGYKLFSTNTDVPQIYSKTNENDRLAINTYSPSMLEDEFFTHEIPIGLKNVYEDDLVISLADVYQLPDSIDILLVDHNMLDTINLQETDYSFIGSGTNNSDNRFSIIITKNVDSGTGISELNTNIYAYTSQDELIVESSRTIKNGRIIVSDMMGRTIINRKLTSKERIQFPIPEKTNIFVVNILTDKTILYRKTLMNK